MLAPVVRNVTTPEAFGLVAMRSQLLPKSQESSHLLSRACSEPRRPVRAAEGSSTGQEEGPAGLGTGSERAQVHLDIEDLGTRSGYGIDVRLTAAWA